MGHQRLGHVNSEVVQASISNVQGIAKHELTNTGNFEICRVEKSTRVPIKAVTNDEHGAIKALERVFSDTVGTMKHTSISNSRYFVTIFDFDSVYSMVRFVGRKREVAGAAIGAVKQIKNIMNGSLLHLTSAHQNNVKWLKTDGGSEYIGCDFQNWVTQRGVVQALTTAYFSESDGSAERLNRTLLDIARKMLLGIDVSQNDF